MKNLSLREHETLRYAQGDTNQAIFILRGAGCSTSMEDSYENRSFSPLSPPVSGESRGAGGSPQPPSKGASPLVESPLRGEESSLLRRLMQPDTGVLLELIWR